MVFHSSSLNTSSGFSKISRTAAPIRAIVEVCMPMASWRAKPIITSPRTTIDLTAHDTSVTHFSLPPERASSAILSSDATRLFRKANIKNAQTATIIIKTIGVSSFIKSIKDKLAALPIMMFGGSPIRVAVPPMFDENISAIRNGTGLISSFSAIANVIGITRMTVVTLSRNALTNAVKNASAGSINIGLPRVSESIFTAA